METLNTSSSDDSIAVLFSPQTEKDQVFLNRFNALMAGQQWHRVDTLHSGVGLVCSDQGIAMRNADEPQHNDIQIDFLSAALRYRQAKGGGKNEAIVKAIGIKGATDYHVVDATAGFGTDAFVLASVGCHVTMFERSPLVATLLADALWRLQQSPENQSLATRLTLRRGDSAALLRQTLQQCNDAQARRPDAIYLDPMFPHRRKSALVKKEMQALQSLLGVDPDADELLAPALSLATKRVVVKRPASAPFLHQQKPTVSTNTKKHRYDIYIV